MRQTFIRLIGSALLVGLGVLPGRAQYLFKDAPDGNTSNGLAAYRQNFDALSGKKELFSSNTTLLGVYARHSLDADPNSDYETYVRNGTLAKLGPDDGSEGPRTNSYVDADGTSHGASWYHFGPAAGQPGTSDRALGGIAATNTSPGKGYVGIRLKNLSSKTIVNLEIQYALEQWYNSSQTQAANVTVDYRKSSTAITSPIILPAGASWTPIPELGVPAPSTSTAIAPRNGNASTNRRVKQTTLMGLNLGVNQEVMIRFGYVFDSGTNGNGLSVDDIVITPETNIYYSSTASNDKLDQRNSWNSAADGTGTAPNNFTTANTTYYVRGSALGADRIAGTWSVTGSNSKIVVGTKGVTGSGAETGATGVLYVNSNDQIVGTVDVTAGSTLQINQVNNNIALGALHPSSTVEYVNDGTDVQNVKGASYGTLKLTGTGPKSLTGSVLLNTGLAFNTTGASLLTLKDYDLLLLKGATITGLNGANTYFVTNGKGSLRRTVSNDNVAVLFPVGTSTTSYTPATLKQNQAQSEDTYSVRVAPNAYLKYSAAGDGIGSPVVYKNVQRTWFVDEEVDGNSSITLGLQWNTAEAVASFANATAHVNHFENGTWDKYIEAMGTAAGSVSGSRVATRGGISSFSPFGVSSRVDGALPVELTAFAAQRVGSAVACTWATASEKNSRDFTVERSADGREFAALGKVAAAGSSTAARNYRFVDAHPLPGRAYYRLRQTDLDGTEAFSPVVLLTDAAPAPQGLAVVPNPGSGQFAVVLTGDLALTGPAVVRNLLGAEVLRVAVQTGETSAAFDLSGQPAGIYLVQVETAGGLRSLRVVKQ